jgi:UDP-N-acetylglucosamine--N-acetylmuramyl-(pentapeptide) pyrophosphoryl-undecaprenol N-acetylglucosamine transferase
VTAPTILIAGGGTGGHVFPAVAVAEAMRRAADVEVVFCGTERGVEARVVPAMGCRLVTLEVEPLKGGGLGRAAKGTFVAGRATARAFALVRDIRPKAVLSVGGYASGPVSLAAALMRVPIAVLEPNSVVGLANRLLAPFARRAYIAWETAGAKFRPDARRLLGVPLRSGFRPVPYASRGTARVLVMGGSQGAAPLNDRLPAAAALVARHLPALEVLHQAGRDRDGKVRERYAHEGVKSATVVPFIDDVAGAIAAADLVVARAGAGTLAELSAIGRAAVLVPFPLSADDHQGKNAEALAGAGAAVCLRQEGATPEVLAAALEGLLINDAARSRMADLSAALGRPDAAREVAADLLALAGTALREAA